MYLILSYIIQCFYLLTLCIRPPLSWRREIRLANQITVPVNWANLHLRLKLWLGQQAGGERMELCKQFLVLASRTCSCTSDFIHCLIYLYTVSLTHHHPPHTFTPSHPQILAHTSSLMSSHSCQSYWCPSLSQMHKHCPPTTPQCHHTLIPHTFTPSHPHSPMPYYRCFLHLSQIDPGLSDVCGNFPISPPHLPTPPPLVSTEIEASLSNHQSDFSMSQWLSDVGLGGYASVPMALTTSGLW